MVAAAWAVTAHRRNASAAAAWIGLRARPLHLAATAFFILLVILSTYDRPGDVQILGLGFAAIWVVVAGFRFLRSAR